MVMAVLLTFVAGVLGTLLGGVLGLRIDPKSSQSLSCLLAFSAGMMISMICFDLMPEALEQAGLAIAVAGCGLGVLLLLKFDGLFLIMMNSRMNWMICIITIMRWKKSILKS